MATFSPEDLGFATTTVAPPSFDTKLSSQEELAFKGWKSKFAPKDSGADYDLRGAFKEGLEPDPQTGHWPDTYKKPNHPTFSDQSKYAAYGKPGRWEGEKYIPYQADKTEYAPEELGFGEHALKTLKRAGKAVVKDPLMAVPGAAEALVGGVAGIASAAGGGILGLVKGARTAAQGKGTFEEGFRSGLADVEELFQQLPLQPETKVGKKLLDVLSLIPEGTMKAGDVVFEKTGSALLGAGTTGILNLLTLKPSLAAKAVGGAFKSKTEGKTTAAAFDELVTTNPAEARDLARHVGEADPALKKELDKRIDSITISKPKQLKALTAKAVKPSEMAVSEMDVTDMFNQAKANRVADEHVAIPLQEPKPGGLPEGVQERRGEARMPDPEAIRGQLEQVNAQRAEALADPAKAGMLEELNSRAQRLGNQARELELNAREADKLIYGPGPQHRATAAAVRDTLDMPGVGQRDPFKGPGKSQAGAVKLPGGMWHPEAVERLAEPLVDKLMTRSREHLAALDLQGAEEGLTSTAKTEIAQDRAAQAWSTKAVRNYLNKYAGTERDPLKDVEVPFGEGTVRWEELTDKVMKSRPARDIPGYGQHPTTLPESLQRAPAMEPIFDVAGAPRVGNQVDLKALPALQSFISHMGDYARQNIPPEKLQQYDFVRLAKETSEADKRVAKEMEKAAAESSKDLPVYKEYPDGMRWVELKEPKTLTPEQETRVRKATKAELKEVGSDIMNGEFGDDMPTKGYVALDSKGKPIKNSYTEALAIEPTKTRATLAGWLAEEGNQMGHCVGGYCEGVASGESKIYSLRDKKGLSHVTIEVDPRSNTGLHARGMEIERFAVEAGRKLLGKDKLPELTGDITQIKGKQNRAPNQEYLPYVQDFVKEGKWGEVGDLEHTGLASLDLKGWYDKEPKFMQELEAAYPNQRYVPREELEARWKKHLEDNPVLQERRIQGRLQGPRDPFAGPGRNQRGAVGDLGPKPGEVDSRSVVEAMLTELGGPDKSKWNNLVYKNAADYAAMKARATASPEMKAKYEDAVKVLQERLRETQMPGPKGPGSSQRGGVNIDPIADAIEAGKKAQQALGHAFTTGKGALREFPGVESLERELINSYDALIRSVSPESRGPEARTAAAVLGSAMAKQARADSVRFYSSEPRRRFWDQLGPEQSKAFIDHYERGTKFQDPTLSKAAEGYRNWNEEIYQAEKKAGINYEAKDNYLTHLYEDKAGVERYLHNRYGSKWNDPYFMKERGFEMYAAAEKAGYKPKFTNPEEIMLAREHSSNVAQMKIQALNDMTEFGVARELKKGEVLDVREGEWRSPNGKRYALSEQANQIMHNAFNTASLWGMENAIGSTFRAAMLMKNTILPIKLMSLFHPVHVATMQGADALVSSTRGLAADKIGVGKYTLDAIGNSYFKNLVGVSKQGYRLRNVWEGKVPESELTVADKRALQYMEEGGFIADLSPELKTNWTTAFTKAVDQGKYGSAAFKLPFYLLETVFQKPVMEIWIPSLKTAAYVNAASKALEAAPDLIENRQARMEAFRKIQKSVDNRFGEMQYNTTFMNRTVKDIGVASLLSLGWQLGFLREYGGAAAEAYKGAKNPGELAKMTSRGELDKALFVTFYTTQAMMLGGLMTYALTGTTPQSLLDYIYPRTGDVDKDGKPERVSTPYYTREFMAVSKHVAQEGAFSGAAHLVSSKLSPAIGIVKAWATNLDFFGKEISDPDSPLMKQVGQKVAWTLSEMEPLMTSAAKRRPRDLTAKDIALGAAGFSPAPAYATKSDTEAAISSTFQRYHKSATPYERAEFGPDNAKLKTYLAEGDGEKFNEQLGKMKEKYNLSRLQMDALRRGLRADPNVKMFKALSDSQQIALIKKMPPEDRETYERHMRKSARARLED